MKNTLGDRGESPAPECMRTIRGPIDWFYYIFFFIFFEKKNYFSYRQADVYIMLGTERFNIATIVSDN